MMERNTKLEAARRLRGWTLEVASQKIGVHPQTLRRWETGKSRPHGFRIYKISEVYEMTPSALGIGSERHRSFYPGTKTPPTEDLLLARIAEPLMTIDELDLHLMGLILQRKLDRQNLDYQTFQQQIHQCIQAYDDSARARLPLPQPDDPARLQALRVVASIPIAAYLENTTPHALPAPPEEILTHCASAITACWHMDLSQDLTLLRSFVSGYIILLSDIFSRVDRCQQAAAELIAQSCLLRTMLALQLEGPHASVTYYTRALEFGQIAENAGHAGISPIHANAPYGYGKQPARTLQEMAEALWLLKPTPPPPDFSLIRNYLEEMSSIYQITAPSEFEETDEAPSDFPTFSLFSGSIDYAEAALNLWDGVTYHELGEYAQALDNAQSGSRAEPVCDAPEQVRGEFLHNRALASLRLHDMDQSITTLRAAIPQALSMGNERDLVEAREAYHMMQFLSPNEPTAPGKELKDLLKKHD